MAHFEGCFPVSCLVPDPHGVEMRTKLTWVAIKNTHPKKEGGEKEVGAEGRGWTERYHTSERGRRLEKAGGSEQEIERERAKEGVKTSKREKGE